MADTTVCSGAGATHKGRKAHNEDHFFVDNELGLYVVADGVGGQDAGEIASEIACSTIADALRRGESLTQSIGRANEAILGAIEAGHGRPGMATTVVALRIQGDNYEIAWLGDSRVYLWDGKLKLMSRDHSVVETLLARGEISLEEAQSHPKKNVILAALGGGDADITVGENGGILRKGSRFLLCSDGLSDVLSPSALAERLSGGTSEAEIADELVRAAVDLRGKDNITAVVVGVQEALFDLAAEDEGVEVVRTFDPETGVHEYHSKARVQTSRKVKKLQTLSVTSEDLKTPEVNPAVETVAQELSSDRASVFSRYRISIVTAIIIATIGLVLLL